MDLGYFLRRLDIGTHVDANKEALIFEKEIITYGQLKDRSYRLANALRLLGVNKGDRVAVFLKNCLEWFDIFFALASLGAILTPINFLLKSKEVEYIINDSGASILFCGSDLVEQIDFGKKGTPTLRDIIIVGHEKRPGALNYSTIINNVQTEPHAEVSIQTDDLFLLQYTSGTTGFPKGAMHSHGTLMWNSFHQIGDFRITSNERYLCVPGLCWIAGFHDFTLATLWMGGTVVVMPSGSLQIDHLLRLIEKEKITKVLLVPTILKQIVDFRDLKAYRLDTLDFIATGAEPVPVSLIQRFNELLPRIPLLQGYGLSEGPSIALYLPQKDAWRKIGSAGRPSTNCELMIVDESMRKVPPGIEGEIVIRSPATMVGYWNRPEDTEKVFAGGWLHTGDLGEYDEEGYIYIKGRKKDMYISGGLNVYPAEIENIILKDSRIKEVAVIGIEDQKWGEVGCAIIVPQENTELTEEEITKKCQQELAGYKIPKRFIFRKKPLPRTASGKIKKYELKDEIRKIIEEGKRGEDAYSG